MRVPFGKARRPQGLRFGPDEAKGAVGLELAAMPTVEQAIGIPPFAHHQNRIADQLRHQRALAIGHGVGGIVLVRCQLFGPLRVGRGEIGQGQRLHLACAAGLRRAPAIGRGGAFVEGVEFARQLIAQPRLQPFALFEDATRIGDQHLFGEIGLARQHQQFAAHLIVQRLVGGDGAHSFGDCLRRR